MALLFSAYLTWLELFVIGAVCRYCVASAALMAASLVFAILRARSEPSGGALARPHAGKGRSWRSP